MANNSQQIARLLQMLLRNSRGKMSMGWMIALVVVVGGYLVFEPALEARLGIDLPGIHSPDGEVAETDIESSTEQPNSPSRSEPSAKAEAGELSQVLKEVGRDTFESPAGILYTRGSQHGTRLKHLMSHATDQPNRRGQHGVFGDPVSNSDAATVVLLVDEAYEQAIAGRNTKKTVEGNRTVYNVNLGRTIGYIGGQSGGRRNHPKARHVRLVMEGKKLITGFPVIP